MCVIILASLGFVGKVATQQETSLPRIENWRPGDAHIHSVHSWPEAWESIREIASDAKTFGLEWIIMTDHSYWLDSAEWEQGRRESQEAEAATGVVCMYGEEISVNEFGGGSYNIGHYLGYGLTSFIPSLPPYNPWPSEPEAQDAIDEVNDQGGVGFIAHPMASIFFGWENFAVSDYTGIEVWNGAWGWDDEAALHLWDKLLVQALIGVTNKHVVGIGNSDAHPWTFYKPSTWLYLYLPNLNKEGIVEAFKNGHVVFTDGPLLAFKIDNQIIGETVQKKEGSTVTLDIEWKSTGFGEMQKIRIIKMTAKTRYTYELHVGGESGTISWNDPTPIDGPCYYRLEGQSFKDNPSATPDETHFVYTNPIWISIPWNYVFADSYGRGTILKVNTSHQLFQFITPDRDYGIRKASTMYISDTSLGTAILILHEDGELRLLTKSVGPPLDVCGAFALDKKTGKDYYLIDKTGIEN